ncbi:MAG: plasmid partitioning protein RepB [Phyllobacterium sp.]|uniref:plasmid partitioning protein RepB n=1 Tax=Phyllobacterium sp. TaxID=1871046 RepID=UPI0030F12ECD
MARKNIFESIMHGEPDAPGDAEPSAGFRKFGAAKSMSSSIDELARQASKLVDGETVVDLDPDLLDASFVTDRMPAGDDEEYRELFDAIRERGQDSPILVRPHPKSGGRYMIVFGHRRARVAKELGRPVRAIVKPLADLDHVISQGQENSARANLSFIERVSFADRLETLGYTRDAIQAALSVDYQTLSKMLTIPKAIPEAVIAAIGPAKGVGRDRWLELRKLIENPRHTADALAFVARAEVAAALSPERFDLLLGFLKGGGSKKPVRRGISAGAGAVWAPADQSVSVATRFSGKTFSIALNEENAKEFGVFITNNLDQLYEAFKESKGMTETGD